ncbi:MAG: hypothetical protein SNJ61_05290 [Fimbriimonadaceae bacterium]
MKKLGLAGAVVVLVVAIALAAFSGYRSFAPPKVDEGRFPKPDEATMAKIRQLQDAYKNK